MRSEEAEMRSEKDEVTGASEKDEVGAGGRDEASPDQCHIESPFKVRIPYSGLICNCSPNVIFEGTTRRRTT